MIRGHLIGLQMRVGVVFRLPEHAALEIEFVIDTGFEGQLTLPAAAVTALQLPFLYELTANLANNQNVLTDVHLASVLWDGAARDVAVLALGTRPLLGTALLSGHELHAQFVDGGVVVLENISGIQAFGAPSLGTSTPDL